jgi:hypothetical protein
MDELGYAAGIPPCMWGAQAEGLRPPLRLSLDTRLRSVQVSNASSRHYAVMNQWQCRGAWTD